MKYKYELICPYFGQLPNNFQLWLESCKYNTDFHFIVFTNDNTKYNIPNNVDINILSFEDFKKKIQSKFNFRISLDNPYKLCDFKVTYGYVFEDILNCEYWGYCDMDLIFGNIKKFLPNKKYSKISHEGHFCLIKNNKKYREAFMSQGNSKINYITILSSKVHFGFDEIGEYGINKLFENNNYSIYSFEKHVADINCKFEGLNITSGNGGKYKTNFGKRVFEFNKGSIVGYNLHNAMIEKEEYAYIHFQKRKMLIDINPKYIMKFLILHHSIENKYDYVIDKMFIEEKQPKKKFNLKLNIKLKKKAILVRIKRKLFYKKRGYGSYEKNNG